MPVKRPSSFTGKMRTRIEFQKKKKNASGLLRYSRCFIFEYEAHCFRIVNVFDSNRIIDDAIISFVSHSQSTSNLSVWNRIACTTCSIWILNWWCFREQKEHRIVVISLNRNNCKQKSRIQCTFECRLRCTVLWAEFIHYLCSIRFFFLVSSLSFFLYVLHKFVRWPFGAWPVPLKLNVLISTH